MSFTEMMQQAIQIRTSTDAKLRVDFDSRPKFQQSSMFATQEVRETRGLPLEARLAVCTATKLRGNEQMRVGKYTEACQTYEQALAMFWYLDNHNDIWKTSGIKDEDITEVNFCPACGVEALEDEARDLKVALLLNIARAYFAQSDYTTSVKACGAALATNPSSAKALYLRGKALVTPASAGAFETEEAIRDVSRAADLAPGDNVIRAFLAKLRAEKARQKEADRVTFAGMFDRGKVCDPEAESKARRLHAPTHGDGNAERGVLRSAGAGEQGEVSTAAYSAEGRGALPPENDNDDGGGGGGGNDDAGKARGENSSSASERGTLEMRRDVEERVATFKGMVRECDEEGRDEEANQYRERVEAIEEILSEHDRQEQERVVRLRKSHAEVDWRNPSEAMRKRATEEELDLDNPAVIGFLVKMQESHQAGLEAKRGDGKEGDWDKSNKTEREKCQPGEDDDQDNWTEEVWEGAILCMTRPEVTSLLKEEFDIDPRPDIPLRDLRSQAVCKLLGERPSAERSGSASSATSDKGPKRKRADWKISAAISLLLFFFKAYQMGLLKWLLTGGNPNAGTVGPQGLASSMANDGKSVEQGAEAVRGRVRGRRGWERRSLSSGIDTDDPRREESVVDSSDVGGNSLAARVLASATQTADSAPSEESHGDWCDSSVGGACIAGREQGQAVNPTAEDEFEFISDKSGGEENNRRNAG